MTAVDDDDRPMARALALAERGRATARPNPLVGCVVVRDGEVVGEGWHARAGGPHAEVLALEAAGDAARGATVYVTLEPCAHTGRTGPCTTRLAEAGVARVVYAVDDPHPDAAGGAEALRDAGIEVVGGVLRDAAEAQNEVFLHVQRSGRPHVTLKLAQSLDGRVAARDRSSRWITSDQARTRAHALRAAVDAVVVGSGTVLADDPELTVRHVEAPLGQPSTVVLDTTGRTPPTARVARHGTVVLTTAAAPSAWRAALAATGVEVVDLPDTRGDVALEGRGGVSLPAVLAELTDRGSQAVLVEGGPTVAAAFVRQGLVDRLVLHVAPSIIGGDGVPALSPPGVSTVAEAWRWDVAEVARLGPDIEIVARPDREVA